MTDLIELLKSAQGAGVPITVVAVWLLYRIDKNINAMKTSNEVLTDTLLRLVPGFKDARDKAVAYQASKPTGDQ